VEKMSSWERLMRSILRELIHDLVIRVRVIEAKLSSIERSVNELSKEIASIRERNRRRIFP